MKWLDKAFLFALGILLLAQNLPDTSVVVAALAAIAEIGFTSYFQNRRIVVVTCIVWTGLSLFFPTFGCFWPLLLYDIIARRLYPLVALFIACVVANAGVYPGMGLPVLVFGAAAAVLLGLRSVQAEHAAKEALTVRDAAAETTLELNRKNRELLDAQDYDVHIATLTERGRIAREIHDNVGHMLARAMLQTGAAMAVCKDEDTVAGLAELKDTLTMAMNCVRQSVHDLRDDSFDLYGMVRTCIHDFSSFECNLNFDMAEDAPKDVQYCFAAVIREAFANTSRHSDATHVDIDVQEHPAFYALSFLDNGTSGAHTKNQGGMGLDNMRERVLSLAGKFYIDRQNGFAVRITIPKTRRGQV